VRDAANAFEGILSPAEDSQEQPEAVEAEAEETVSDVEDSQDYEEAVEATEDEVVDEYEMSDEDDDAEEVEEQPQTFRVKAAGEEKDVTLDELMQGYQLGADYTKKTQELAELRKANEAESKAIQESKQVRDTYAQRLKAIEEFLMQGYQLGADYTKKTQELAELRKANEAEQKAIQESKQVRDTYAQRLKAIEEFLTQGDSQEDLAALKENDPIGYAVKVAEQTEKREQIEAVRAEQNRLAQQQQAEYQSAMSRFVQDEAQKLTKILPEFSDKTKGEQLRNEIRNYGKSVGFTDDELAQVYDHRQVLTLHKAMMYDKLQKSKPTVKKKVAEAPKMAKAGTKIKEGNRDVQRKQMDRLRQSGRKEDAAALFENFI
jgi:hypothetical protein